MIGFFVNKIDAGPTLRIVEKLGAKFISVMFYSKQTKEKQKEKFCSDIGTTHSKFRYSLLITSILETQDNSFNTFKKTGGQPGDIEILDS